MTRKDYVLIAKYIKLNRQDFNPLDDGYTLLNILSEQLANEFQAENPRFNKRKFLTACGVYDEQIAEVLAQLQD